mmetsp:Transcript_48814/g.135438  ORF Transcript_48814/g.135438 Transcript_48814/m.135438 type:complete len:200 (+) Transcript_48814:460-1059(+)
MTPWSLHLDSNRHHLNRRDRAVVLRLDLRDLHHHVERSLVDALAEDGVLRLARREPVEEVVVDGVHEELRAARVGGASVGHRQRAGLVRDLRRVLVRDVAAAAALTRFARLQVLVGAVGRAARARAARLGVLGVGAAKLVHEVGDDAVEVEAVVEAGVREVNEARHRDRHLLQKELARDAAHRGLENDFRVPHDVSASA